MSILTLVALVLVVFLVLAALCLRQGAKWAKLRHPHFLLAVLVTILSLCVGVIAWSAIAYDSRIETFRPGGVFIAVLLMVFSPWLFIRLLCGGPILRSMFAWLVFLAGEVVIGLALLFGVIPMLLDAYRVIDESMAPTIRSGHILAECPRCGAEFVMSELAPDRHAKEGAPGICERCFHTDRIESPFRPQKHLPDLVLCNKTVAPKRWDVVLFRDPLDSKLFKIDRVVGLPGEELEIRDGAVWVNGTKQTPPSTIGPVTYAIHLPPLGAYAKLPLRLEPDQFYVLGDNPESAFDSRFWGGLARTEIVGVADVICWPPRRWRVLP